MSTRLTFALVAVFAACASRNVVSPVRSASNSMREPAARERSPSSSPPDAVLDASPAASNEVRPVEPTPSASSAPLLDDAPDAPTTLTAPRLLVDMVVPGFGDAVVAVPIGTHVPRPIVIATHANYDRPEWQCEQWLAITARRAWVLCPRGRPQPITSARDGQRFTYPNRESMTREIEAGLEKLRETWGRWVADGCVVYTGFSLGAWFGPAHLAATRDAACAAVFAEGGGRGWSEAVARRFAQRGGRRVLFACGQDGCMNDVRGATAVLERSGVETRVRYSRGAGHWFPGRVAQSIATEFEWVVAGDERFAP